VAGVNYIDAQAVERSTTVVDQDLPVRPIATTWKTTFCWVMCH